MEFQNEWLTWLDARNSCAEPEMLEKLQAVNQPQALIRRYSVNDNHNNNNSWLDNHSRCLGYALAKISISFGLFFSLLGFMLSVPGGVRSSCGNYCLSIAIKSSSWT